MRIRIVVDIVVLPVPRSVTWHCRAHVDILATICSIEQPNSVDTQLQYNHKEPQHCKEDGLEIRLGGFDAGGVEWGL